MPTPTKGPRLGGSPAHQRHIIANLATALFEHGKITTTETRARRLRPVAERLITFAKRGDLHARRQVLASLSSSSETNRRVVKTLFADIAPTFAGRDGGYTRITKIGPRKGDNAPLAVIELVPEEAEARPRRRRARRTQPAARPRRQQAAATTEVPETGADASAEEPEPDDAAASAAEAGPATAVADTGAEEAEAGSATAAADTGAEDAEAGSATAAADTGAEDAADPAAEPEDEADSDDEPGDAGK